MGLWGTATETILDTGGELLASINPFGSEPKQEIQGVTVCTKNRVNATPANVDSLIRSVPATLQGEWIQRCQLFVSREHDRKPKNSQKVGLPTRVTLENVTGCTLYLLGGENDCDFGGLEKEWEAAWIAWRNKAAATAGARTGDTGGVTTGEGLPGDTGTGTFNDPISGTPSSTGVSTTTQPTDPCSGLPEPLRSDCQAALRAGPAAFEEFTRQFRRERAKQTGAIPIETVMIAGAVVVAVLLFR